MKAALSWEMTVELLCAVVLAGLLAACHEPRSATSGPPQPQQSQQQSQPQPASPFPEQATAILEHADTIEILALAPGVFESREQYESSREWLLREFESGAHAFAPDGLFPGPDVGYAIVARRTLSDPDDIRRVVDALYRDVDAESTQADCFNPRHALRVRRGDRTFEATICYECGRAYFEAGDWRRDSPIGGWTMAELFLDWQVPRCRPDRRNDWVCADESE